MTDARWYRVKVVYIKTNTQKPTTIIAQLNMLNTLVYNQPLSSSHTHTLARSHTHSHSPAAMIQTQTERVVCTVHIIVLYWIVLYYTVLYCSNCTVLELRVWLTSSLKFCQFDYIFSRGFMCLEHLLAMMSTKTRWAEWLYPRLKETQT